MANGDEDHHNIEVRDEVVTTIDDEEQDLVLMIETDDYEYELDSDNEIQTPNPKRRRTQSPVTRTTTVSIDQSDVYILNEEVTNSTKKFSIKDINCAVCSKSLDPEKLSTFKDVFEDSTAKSKTSFKDMIAGVIGEVLNETSYSSLLCERCEALVEKIDELTNAWGGTCLWCKAR